MGFEEGDLWLHDREPAEGIDADVAELPQAVDAAGKSPRRQQLGMRVDAETQRTTGCHRGGRPGTEVHQCAAPSWLCSSCSDSTPMSPRMPASIPCTAADAPCTVVMHGMFIATAAARIS